MEVFTLVGGKMSTFVLENRQAQVSVDEHASEIHSFCDLETDNEYMWQGDPKYWSGRNPTLFPMVGSTWDKKLHINGKEYVTGNHGFTRHSDFTCIEHDDHTIVMELKDNAETYKEYPFHFTLHITYTLQEKTLSIHYEITNDNDVVMPFNFGLHPAFNCPCNGGNFEDYYIELNQPETSDFHLTHLKDCSRIDLDRKALEDTIIIADPKSTQATLTDGKHGVTVGFKGYEWLAFWSKANAPYVCIEPWHSHADFEKVDVPFEKREGTISLEPHKVFKTDYTITIF